MDTQAPTAVEKLAEEGTLAPASTPIQSLSSPSTRSPRQFEAHSTSPLHASSRSTSRRQSSLSRTPSSIHEERGQVEVEGVPRHTEKHRPRRRMFRRSYGSTSKRYSKESRGSKEARDEKEEKKSWVELLRKSRYSPSIVLKNTGAVARDHLASERTFLAYVRTSMALASMGVALVQLFAIADITSRALGTDIPTSTPDVQKFARPLGALTIALAFCVLLIGVYRYFKIQFTLPDGNFPIARLSAIFTSFVFSAIVVTIFGAVLSGRT